jgi:hypothetical protein
VRRAERKDSRTVDQNIDMALSKFKGSESIRRFSMLGFRSSSEKSGRHLFRHLVGSIIHREPAVPSLHKNN